MGSRARARLPALPEGWAWDHSGWELFCQGTSMGRVVERHAHPGGDTRAVTAWFRGRPLFHNGSVSPRGLGPVLAAARRALARAAVAEEHRKARTAQGGPDD